MLYDPKWEVKADPFTLKGLIAWLEQQPPEKTYCFYDYTGECLLDQYLASVTGEESKPQPHTHWVTCGGSANYLAIARDGTKTFGAALARARAVHASHE